MASAWEAVRDDDDIYVAVVQANGERAFSTGVDVASDGIVSAVEPIGMLWRGMPLGDVLRWALMGNEKRITAETALRLGLVTEVVTRADLQPRARQIAASITARNPKAILGTTRRSGPRSRSAR